MYPQQRTSGLVMSEAGTDLVVFDAVNQHLHTIPTPIATVWRACDGASTVADIAVESGLPSLQVEAALVQLAAVDLLQSSEAADIPSHSRRSLVRKAALGAAILSVTVPGAARAASGQPDQPSRNELSCNEQYEFSANGSQDYGFDPPCVWNFEPNATETICRYVQGPWSCWVSELTCDASGQTVPLTPWTCQNIG